MRSRAFHLTHPAGVPVLELLRCENARTRAASSSLHSVCQGRHRQKGRTMPARTGRQYLEGLRSQEREVWLGGKRIDDVTTHPALASGARAIASLYDMQCEPQLKEIMTYRSPTTGHPVGLSFIIPRTPDDLVRRREMMLRWARATCGMMGRSPDFMNVTFAAWAAAGDYFARGRPQFGDNMR